MEEETQQTSGGKKTYGYNPEQFKKFKRHGWVYLVMFSLLYMCLYCCRLNLSNASGMMIMGIDEGGLGWTTSDIGILTSTLFWTYGIGQLVNGRLSEVVGPTKILFFGVLLSVLCNFFISLQSSLVVMAIAWGLNGFFQSMGWTPGLATLTKWWPGDSRGFATGFAHAASGFGQAVATMSVAAAFIIFPDMGWRAAFIVPAAIPLIMLILYKVIAKPTPASIGLEEYTEEDPQIAAAEKEMEKLKAEKGKLYPYKYVLKNKFFLIWLIVAFGTGLCRYGLVTWVPLYFVQVYDVNVTSGLIQSLTLPVGMGIGTLIIPWLTDRFCPHNRLAAVIVSALITTVAVFAFFFLDPTTTGGLVATEIVLFLAGFGIYGINGTVWAFATDIGGRVFSGTAGGLLDCSAYIGAGVQSMVYGFVLNAGGWNIVFLSLALFCFLIAVAAIVSTKMKSGDAQQAA